MAELTSRQRYEFRRQLDEIEKCHGRGTELISLYVPSGKQISDVSNHLRSEYSQSSNIKSKTTRKNVMAAIESIMSKLKYFKKPPENGMVFFVGHKEAGADRTDMVAFVIEPPEPIATFLYRCDSDFYLDPLKEMLLEKDNYGLIVVDRSEATIGKLTGKRIDVVRKLQSLVPSKHRMGGQSARRFERLIEIAAHEYFKKVAKIANESFLAEKDLEGILIGGPGATKDFFAEKDYLNHELKKKIIDTFDTGYTDEYGLKELVEKAQKTLSGLELMKEKELVQKLMDEIRKPDGGLAAYGPQVEKALEMGAIDLLLISEGLDKSVLRITCPSCGFSKNTFGDDSTENDSCPECGSELKEGEENDLVGQLFDTAEKVGTKIEMISQESEEGDLFLRTFGGMAGLMRFKLPSED
ncbi:MAG: peptide chain release factor 1 [Methanobacteriota archaeon]|nr:MAG: peptide chain release factor 1 [Euryarchaeota archaeon]